jgi:hypothetical protein
MQQGKPMSELNEVEKGQLCQSTIESLYEATGGMKQFPGLLKKIIANKAWERRLSKGKVIELASLRELITEKPVRGWGEDVRTVESVIKDDPECLAMFREAMKEQGGDRKSEDAKSNRNIVTDRSDAEIVTGNSRAYSIDRVKRECKPEVIAKVMSGEMSPNAALVKAGIRENRQVYIPREPARAVEKLRELFGDEFVSAMFEASIASRV